MSHLQDRRTYPLVAVEGVDAAGKATATAAIVTWLLEAGYDASSFSFPAYDSPTGRLLGQHLRDEWSVQPSGARLDVAIVAERRHADMMVRQALMTANRISRALLRPDLWIVLDGDPAVLARRRVAPSCSTAGGPARVPTGGRRASILAGSPALRPSPRSKRRCSAARDLNERDLAKLRRVREAYRLLAFNGVGGQWVLIDAEQAPSVVAQQCRAAVGRFLPDQPESPASRVSPG